MKQAMPVRYTPCHVLYSLAGSFFDVSSLLRICAGHFTNCAIALCSQVNGKRKRTFQVFDLAISTILKLVIKVRALYFFASQTYREIIRNPMDLGSVQTRLLQHSRQGDAGTYSGPRQFLNDLELIVNNSRLFNRDSETQVNIEGC